MKKSALLVLFIVLSKSNIWAQNVDQTSNTANTKAVPPLKHKSNSVLLQPATPSDYNFKDAQIKAMMIDGIIPQDFPKYDYANSTPQKYDAIIDIWVSNNSTKVKPEYKKNSTTTEK